MYLNEVLPWGTVHVQSLQAYTLQKKKLFSVLNKDFFKQTLKFVQFNLGFIRQYFAL